MKRDDLQGIRGLAIVAVLAFHFFPLLFPNGYIGVDIFFVLSGFLMTMIFGSRPITSQSVVRFYYRRAKRILPLYLLVILIGCICVFWFFPNTFFSINMDSAWSSIFLYRNMAEHSDNNLYFKMLNQAEDIFTHTWSLCVEMQFYVLAPTIFYFLSLSPTRLFMAFFYTTIIIASLGNQLLSTDHVAFNSVFCRIWQFMIGSAVYFLSTDLINIDKNASKYSELLLVDESNEVFDKDDNEDDDDDVLITKPRQNVSRLPLHILLWASLLSLVFLSFAPWKFPESQLRITCTFLSGVIILAGSSCEVNLMKHRILVYMGDISYSLYLIHWPIYVYVKHYHENQIAVYLCAIVVSILLAATSFERFEKWYLNRGMIEIMLMLFTFYASIVLIWLKQREMIRLVENIRYAHEEHTPSSSTFDNITLKEAALLNKKWAREEYKHLVLSNCFPNTTEHGHCEFDKGNLTGNLTVFIVGNSLAPNLGSLVYTSFKNHARAMYKYSNSYCEVLTVANKGRCQKSHDAYMDVVFKKIPDILFILDRPDKLRNPLKMLPVENDEIFKEALTTLRKYENNVKKKIYMLESYTPPTNLRLSQFAKLLEEGKNVTQSLFKVDLSYLNALKRQEALLKQCSKCELIRIADVLFNGNQTKSYDEKTKLGYYYDGLHITPFAMNLIYPLFKNASDSLFYD